MVEVLKALPIADIRQEARGVSGIGGADNYLERGSASGPIPISCVHELGRYFVQTDEMTPRGAFVRQAFGWRERERGGDLRNKVAGSARPVELGVLVSMPCDA
jgi:hypothetical protein